MTTMIDRLTGYLHEFRHDRRGVAALEMSVIGMMMISLMLAAYVLGNAAQQEVALEQAVRTAGEYAIANPTDVGGMQNVLLAALPTGLTLSSPPQIACYCLDTSSGGMSALGACTASDQASCDGASPGVVVDISATLPIQIMTGLTSEALSPVTATYAVRVH